MQWHSWPKLGTGISCRSSTPPRDAPGERIPSCGAARRISCVVLHCRHLGESAQADANRSGEGGRASPAPMMAQRGGDGARPLPGSTARRQTGASWPAPTDGRLGRIGSPRRSIAVHQGIPFDDALRTGLLVSALECVQEVDAGPYRSRMGPPVPVVQQRAPIRHGSPATPVGLDDRDAHVA